MGQGRDVETGADSNLKRRIIVQIYACIYKSPV